eukprot:scaffold306512_cov35-Tisochrysis_lutea.AAC.2
MHVFFANEKIPSYPCLSGALEVTKKLGVPDDHVHGVGEGEAAAVAESYTSLLKSHPSIDNTGAIPSVSAARHCLQRTAPSLAGGDTQFLACRDEEGVEGSAFA